MKKQLLTIALAAISAVAFGQFTIGSTSITFTGHTPPSGSSYGQFYNYQPNNNGGTFYLDNTCSTVGTQSSTGDVGGFDPSNPYDATTVGTPYTASDGVTFFGGGIRNVYYGSPTCVKNSPSIGFFTGTASGGITSGNAVDLSAAANQKISFTYQSNAIVTFLLQLNDQYYNPMLNGTKTFTTVADNAPHTVSIDFSTDVINGADLSTVKQVSFVYDSDTKSPSFGISFANIKVGSAVTGIAKGSDVIAQSKVYPNPASGTATLSLDLKSNSNVKVVLNDLVGKEMKVIAEGNYTSINENFSVADLNKGMYVVTYIVNGSAVKTESLVVR